MRPYLLPSLPRLWRDADTLQLGTDPERAVLIAPADRGTLDFLASLDGRHRLEYLVADPPGGLTPDTARRLVLDLREAGAVVDAAAFSRRARRAGDRLGTVHPDLAAGLVTHGSAAAARQSARRRGHVLIRCRGRTGPVVAALLAAAGVGRVVVTGAGTVGPEDVVVGGLRTDDLGRPYVSAVTDLLRRTAPGVGTLPPTSGGRPDLVVLAAGPLPPPADRVRWSAEGVPHLPVLIRAGIAVLGPLVVPGVTACLTCVEEHRRDRDPAWPALAAQLATDPRPDTAETLVVSTAATLTAVEVTSHLEGATPVTLGASLEVGPPGRPLRQRPWTPHPRCGCLAT